MKNLSLKLWSVLIAILLSYFVYGQRNSSVMSLIVPVELRNLPSEKIVLLPNAPQAQVSVRGPSHLLSDVTKNPLVFSIEVPEEVGTRFVTPLREKMLGLSPSLEVISIEPAEVEFVLDSIGKKQVKVEIPRIGSLGDDYRLNSIVATPSTVIAEGPKTELETIRSAETQQIDLREFTTSADRQLTIRPVGRFTSFDPKTVRVSVKLTPVTLEKLFKGVSLEVITEGEALTNCTTRPKFATVEVSGPKAIVKDLKKKQLNVTVSLPDGDKAAKKTFPQLPVKVELPKDVNLVFVGPEKVDVNCVQ